MEYRFIPFQRYDPYFKTGLNKALTESVKNGSKPVIFLAGWDKACVNLGYSQVFEEEVNVDEFERRDEVVFVRRQGGGGATYLTPQGELTWGVVTHEEEYPDDVNKIYQKVCGKIAKGLRKIGINAEHEPINDIVTEKGKKLSGATLKKENGIIYLGGTLIYKADVNEMFKLLTPSEDKMEDKEIESYRERVSMVTKESEASFDQAKNCLADSLLKDKKYYNSSLTDSELERAKELANKYSNDTWLYRE